MSDKNFTLFILCLFLIAAVASIIKGNNVLCIAGNSMLVGIWISKFINLVKKERQ